MQDDFLKNNENFEAEFVDAAWKDMHALLDAEMPIEKPTRRFFFWWFPLGAAALLLMTYFLWNFVDVQMGNHAQNDSQSDLFVQKSKENTFSKNETEHPDVIIAENTADINVIQNEISKSKSNILKKNKGRKHGSESINVSHREVGNTDVEQQILGEIAAKINNEIGSIRTDELNVLNETADKFISRNDLIVLAEINPIQLKAIPQKVQKAAKDAQLGIDVAKTRAIKKKHQVQLGISTGLSVFDNKDLGYSFGMDIGYHISSRWNLLAGVDYTFLNRNFARKADFVNGNYEEQYADPELGASADNTKNNVPQNQLLSNMLGIPLQIQYSIHPRWKLSSGLQYETSLSKVKAQQISYIGAVDFNLNRHFYMEMKYSKAFSKTRLPNFGGGLKLGYRF